MAAEEFWLDAIDQYISSSEYLNVLKSYVDSNCDSFVDVKTGEHGLLQNEAFTVRPRLHVLGRETTFF